jgi:hypothetical protein
MTSSSLWLQKLLIASNAIDYSALIVLLAYAISGQIIRIFNGEVDIRIRTV